MLAKRRIKILSIISRKDFMKLTFRKEILKKKVKFAELNTKIQTAFLNIQTFNDGLIEY